MPYDEYVSLFNNLLCATVIEWMVTLESNQKLNSKTLSTGCSYSIAESVGPSLEDIDSESETKLDLYSYLL